MQHFLRSIAAAQTVPVRGDVSANLEQHLSLVRAAAERGARLLVFPELSLTGYELDLADRLAFSEDDVRLAPLREAAAEHSMIVIAGAPVRVESALHIGAFVAMPDKTLALYTKPHLGAFSREVSPDGIVPPPEHSVFQRGTRDPLVRCGRDTLAVAVCAASLQRSTAKHAAARGATLYATGHFSIPMDVEWRAQVLSEFARTYGMIVVFANYAGATGGLPASGRSGIWSRTGELIGRLPADGAHLLVARESEAGWSVEVS